MSKSEISEIIKGAALIILGIIFLYAGYNRWASKAVENVEQIMSGNNGNNSSILSKDEFKQMHSDPNKFKGRKVDFYAKVFVTPRKDDKMAYIQALADPESSSENVMIQFQDTSMDIKNNDTIHVIGEVEREFRSENVFGVVISAPLITASKIEKADYGTAFEPSIKTISLEKEINQSGYIIKVHTIVFAKNNTRVYVTITNTSESKVYFNAFAAQAFQGDKQFNIDVGNKNYPELNGNILPGAKEDGVIIFKPLNPDGDNCEFIFKESSDDSNIKINPFTFEVNIQ